VPIALLFTTGVRLDTSGSRGARIIGPGGEVITGDVLSGIVNALRPLAKRGLTYKALVNRAVASAGLDGLRALHGCLGQLLARSWIAQKVSYGDRPIVSAIPLTDDYRLHVKPAPAIRLCVLSRFALLRRDGTQIVIESPTARARVVLHDARALAVLCEMWGLSQTPLTHKATSGRLPVQTIRSMIELLWNAGLLTTVDARNGVPEDETAPLVYWEFHDLLFHTRSRFGRHRSPYGATYHLKGRVAPAPAIKPRTRGKRICLVRPNITRLTETDWSLTRALEARQSQREHGEMPITLNQVGEFLYRSARVRRVTKKSGYRVTTRVYPSGGAAYALELYLAVNKCERLDAGLYHYCPDRHELQRISGMNPDVQRLLVDAAGAAGSDVPQVLVIIAARFLRASWKYSAISYALILKEVGALMQTMYLVATTMNLGVCAIGAGDSDVFAKAAGTNYYDEGSVGEIILGRLPRSGAMCNKNLPLADSLSSTAL
jgi:SagB-type dehydrogenase family enzyme